MVTDFISIASGLISIILAIYAIWYAKKESAQSADNYEKTKNLLVEIERKSELIDRGIQFEQKYLLQIINKILDGAGSEKIEMTPISLEEIDEIFENKTAHAQERLRSIEDSISKMPSIHVGKEPPKESKNGDIWFKITD